MRIILADNRKEVRSALRLVLEQRGDHVIVGESQDAVNLIAQSGRLCPDAVILDAQLAGLQVGERAKVQSLTDLVEALRRLCPSIRMIVLGSHPDLKNEILSAGVDAFFCKSDPPDILLELLADLTN